VQNSTIEQPSSGMNVGMPEGSDSSHSIRPMRPAPTSRHGEDGARRAGILICECPRKSVNIAARGALISSIVRRPDHLDRRPEAVPEFVATADICRPSIVLVSRFRSACVSSSVKRAGTHRQLPSGRLQQPRQGQPLRGRPLINSYVEYGGNAESVREILVRPFAPLLPQRRS
jgi:hypothetical protein